MKALHHHLLIAVHKCLYNRSYLSVICLFCSNVEVSNHVFFCPFDAADYARLVEVHVSAWKACLGLFCSSLCVLYLLFTCISNVVVGTALCKGFVFKKWYHESVAVFKDYKVVAQNIMVFVCEFCLVFHNNVWLVHAKHQTVIEKGDMILRDDSVPVSIFGLFLVLLASIVKLLSIADAFGVGDIVSVHISA
ncbi:hypothetical protein G9A89_013181 [Geosiphon pyriformis]|nr:hypothetical protein G9A89_013181 [Geosiphon pyriformis]